jgi:hypothetical protein
MTTVIPVEITYKTCTTEGNNMTPFARLNRRPPFVLSLFLVTVMLALTTASHQTAPTLPTTPPTPTRFAYVAIHYEGTPKDTGMFFVRVLFHWDYYRVECFFVGDWLHLV